MSRISRFEPEKRNEQTKIQSRGYHRRLKGIGAGIAKSLAAEGAAVVVNYASSKDGADRVVAEIVGKGGKAIAVQGDVSHVSDVRRVFAEAKKPSEGWTC